MRVHLATCECVCACVPYNVIVLPVHDTVELVACSLDFSMTSFRWFFRSSVNYYTRYFVHCASHAWWIFKITFLYRSALCPTRFLCRQSFFPARTLECRGSEPYLDNLIFLYFKETFFCCICDQCWSQQKPLIVR